MTAAVDTVLARWEAARERLTPDQVEALTGLAAGLRVAEIAERLDVPVATVAYRLRAASSRLGARTATAAVAVAVRDHLVEVPR